LGGALFSRSLLADKPLFLVFEEYIERSKGAIDPRNVLLQVYFVLIAEALVPVDLLLEHPKPVTGHDDLVEEDVDRDFFGLDRFVAGLEEHGAALPFVSQRHDLCLSAPELEDLQEGYFGG
jgi:hypothetical protein